MTTDDPDFVCGRCDRTASGEKPDARGWCSACKAAVVKQASVWAWAGGVAVALLYFAGIAWSGVATPRFLIAWLALGLALGFLGFKVARRVAFEVIRARTTPSTAA